MLNEPSALLAVGVTGWLYWRGVRTLWRRAGRGHVVRLEQVGYFAAGLLTVLAALETPLDSLSGDLFAAHMVQHLLLILVAGPLLVLGAPLLPILWSLPADSRRGLGAWWRRFAYLTKLPVAFGLHSLALWLWHIPALYDAALDNRGVHVLEHVCFLSTAMLFWWAVLHGGRAARASGVLYVFGLAIESTLLGALLTFAGAPWYIGHLATTAQWGLTPLEDQQVAGLIMWVPGGAIYVLAALGLFASWLNEGGRRADTPDRGARTPARQ